MINNIAIKKVAEKKINDIGGFLVDLKVSKSNVISLSFDKMDGVKFPLQRKVDAMNDS